VENIPQNERIWSVDGVEIGVIISVKVDAHIVDIRHQNYDDTHGSVKISIVEGESINGCLFFSL
jgi:hypothetical protein